MASPDPSGYHAHPHHHQQPSPPPGAPQHVGSYGHAMEEDGHRRVMERYSDRDISYAEHSQQPLQSEEQPLDLTVSSRPRPGSAEAHHRAFPVSSMMGGHSALHPPSSSSSVIPVSSHPGVCLLKGCSCSNSNPLQPLTHAPHYSGHRHSPYPSQYSPPRSGHRSPGVSGPDSAPLCYTPPSVAPPSGSLMPLEQRGRSSPYFMDRPCRSPHGAGSYMMSSSLSPYASDTLMRPGSSPGSALLYPPPPHTAASPHSLSPHPRGVDRERDSSPRPSSSHASPARVRDVSPRPLYRPFEDSHIARSTAVSSVESTSFSSLATTISSSMTVLGDRYRHTSEDDLTASSSLLLLARPPPPPHASEVHRDYGEEEGEDRRHRETMMEPEEHNDRPSQSDSRARYHQLAPMNPTSQSLLAPPPSYFSSQPVNSERGLIDSPLPRGGVVDTDRSQRASFGPAQDHTVASTSPSTFPDSDLRHSGAPAPSPRPPATPASSASNEAHSSPSITSSSSHGTNVPQFAGSKKASFKVVGTTPLAIVREKRARLQMKQYKENMKSLIAAGGSGRLLNLHVQAQESEGGAAHSENDGSGAAVELTSTGQASPGASSSSTSSEYDLANDFPVPPDPNLKMSALDYLISKVLVEKIDVPFKPFNKEVNDIYTGTKKGRLSLVDLIELRVEASIKAS